ncbi:MAG: ELM1/GtrOC1 family putative glycosyltransferase [Verrucomicrobiota bacterium]
MSHPLKLIRVISEGRPGHENQSVGLAQALARRTGAEVEIVQIPATWNLWTRRRAALAARKGVPQLLIGTGHKVHLPLWFAARKFQARSVVIMEPTWPKGWFDLCVLPQHDADGENNSSRVITTLGALNRLPETIPTKQAKGVVLIGGPSKSHGWSGEQTAAAIRTVIAARPKLAWTISDSRRTPAGFLDQLRAQQLPAEILSHQQTKPDWLPTQLMAAQEAWATEDSVSMIFEAVTAGARTGILPAPVTKPSADPVRAMQKLIHDGYATHYETWTQNGRHLPAPKPLHETGRCAELVLARLFPEARR